MSERHTFGITTVAKMEFQRGLRTAYLREFERVDEALWRVVSDCDYLDCHTCREQGMVRDWFSGDEADLLNADWHRLRVLAETAE